VPRLLGCLQVSICMMVIVGVIGSVLVVLCTIASDLRRLSRDVVSFSRSLSRVVFFAISVVVVFTVYILYQRRQLVVVSSTAAMTEEI
jgi:hypothetical protein